MKEMIQKNRGRLICSAFVMCVGIILGYTCENSLWINGTFAVTCDSNCSNFLRQQKQTAE